MTRDNGYTLVRPLSVGAQGSSWEAAAPGRSEPVVFERCVPSPLWARGSGRDADALGLYLERRALQRRLAASVPASKALGRGHVVPVLDLGVDELGGYAAQPLYDLSLSDFVRNRSRPRGDVLHEIVAGVVAALGAVDAYASRAHGDLDADAVLIRDLRPGQVQVGLRNPLPSRLLGEPAAARRDDLRRLGLLIYELVSLKPFRELGGYPVRIGPEWESLGKDHAAWVDLVNLLLDPKNPALTLAEVAKRLAGITHRKPKAAWRRHVPVAAVTAAVVMAAGAGWFVLAGSSGSTLKPGVFDSEKFERWATAAPAWRMLEARLDELPADLTPALRDRLASAIVEDGRLAKNVLAVLERADEELEDRSWPERVESPWILVGVVQSAYGLERRDIEAGQARTRISDDLDRLAAFVDAGLEVLDREPDDPSDDLRTVFGSAAWAARSRVGSLAASFDSRGWTAAAERTRALETELEAALDTLTSGAADEAAARDAVETVVRTATLIAEAASESAVWSEASLAAMDQRAERLAQRSALPGSALSELVGPDRMGLPPTDPVLESLPALARSAGVMGEGASLDDLRGRLERLGRVLESLDAVAVDGWTSSIDALALRERLGPAVYDGPAFTDAGNAEAVVTWLDRAEAWAVAAVEVGDGGGLAGAADPVSAAQARAERVEKLWNEIEAEDAERGRELAAEFLGVGSYGSQVERSLVEARAALSAAAGSPRWGSLAAAVRGRVESARSALDRADGAAEFAAAEVLKSPEQLIAEWEAREPIRSAMGGESAAWADVLSAVRRELGVSRIGAWRTWQGAAGLDERAVRRADETKALRNTLASLDLVLPWAAGVVAERAGAVEVVGGFAAGPVRDAARSELAAAVAAAARESDWTGEDAWAEGGAVRSGLLDAIGRVEARVVALNADLERLAAVRDELAVCAIPGEDARATAADVRGLVDRLRGDHAPFVGPWPARAGATIDPTVPAEVGALAEAVVSALGSADPVELIRAAAAGGADASHAAVRYAALVRADEIGEQAKSWPVGVAEMGAEAGLLADAVRLIGEDLERARAGASSGPVDRLRGVVFRWWGRGFAAARTEAEIGTLIDAPSRWFAGGGSAWDGVFEESQLGGVAAYNARVYRLRSELLASARAVVGAPRAQRDAMAAGLERETRAAVQRAREIERAAGVDRGWDRAVEEALREFEGGRGGWDANDHGPAGAGLPGWRAELNDAVDPPVVTYRYSGSGEPAEMRFFLVQVGETEQVFLAEDEFSVGMLGLVVDQLRGLPGWEGGGPAGEAREWLEGETEAREVLPGGPVGWTLVTSRRGLRVSPNRVWLDPRLTIYGVGGGEAPAYPEGLVDPSDPNKETLPAGLRPTDDHPVTYVRYETARAVARALKAELPSAGVMRRAIGEAATGPSGWNLRDETVRTQQAFIAEQIARTNLPLYMPGEGCYVDPPEVETFWPGNDGVLWFRPVTESGASRFRNIVGNVAEFVEGGGGASVMGASALSPPSVRPDQVVEIPSTRPRAYDVGFRLAIRADEYGSLASALVKQLGETASDAYVFGGN